MYSIEYLHAMQMFDIYLKIFGNYVTFFASLFKALSTKNSKSRAKCYNEKTICKRDLLSA